MLGVSEAATVGINFPVSYSCCVGSYVNYVNAPAFGIPQTGWQSVTPTGTGYSMPGCPLYIENTNVINTTMHAPQDAFFGQFLNPLPNGSLTVKWGCPTENWSGFAGYDSGHAAQPAPTNAPPRGEAEVYAGFFRDGINFGPHDAACSGGPDNNQPGWYVDVTGLKSLFTNSPFVIQLVAAADSMYSFTNAFITDATASTTQSVVYPSPQHYNDVGDAPWFRAIGGGLSTVSTSLNTDHVKITPNRPQHSAGPTHAQSINNGATLSGFIVTDQPVVTMSPQSVLASGGQEITLNPYAIGVPPLSYQWRKGGVPISGATTSALDIPNAGASAAGSYDLVVTNLYGNATSKIATITMDSISLASGNNYIVDSNPAGAEHDGYNFGATWLASNSDAAGTNRSGVMQFTAADPDQITLPSTQAFNAPTGAISFWIRSAAAPANSAIVYDRRDGLVGSEGNGLVIIQKVTGSLEFQVKDGSVVDLVSASSVSDNKWHHVAFVYNQAVGDSVLYIDGVQEAQQAGNGAWSWSSREIEFGLSHDPAWLAFNGLLDDFRLYSRGLTGAEVASIHTSDALVDTSNLILRLNFDAGPQPGLTLSWQIPGSVLQSADSITGPFNDLSTASPYAAAAQGSKKFYRYRNPQTSVISNPYLM